MHALQQHVGVGQLQWGDALVVLGGREEGGQQVAAPGWRHWISHRISAYRARQPTRPRVRPIAVSAASSTPRRGFPTPRLILARLRAGAKRGDTNAASMVLHSSAA